MALVELDRLQATVVSEDSPLGRWTAAHWVPPPASPLHRIVERVWYFDGTMTHPKERVFPDGQAEIVVMLDEPHRDGDDPLLTPFPAVCVNGLRTRASIVVAPSKRCRVLGIRLEPIGAHMLLRSSMRDLVDVTIDLSKAVGRVSDTLGQRCALAAELRHAGTMKRAEATLHAAADWVLQQLHTATWADPAVTWAASAIQSTRGSVAVERIGARLSLRRSQLARRFSDAVGMTPKRFARVIRFHNALRLLGSSSIAAAAVDLGYYDQAHLYRDFSDFAGITPGAFLAANRYPGGASLAEP